MLSIHVRPKPKVAILSCFVVIITGSAALSLRLSVWTDFCISSIVDCAAAKKWHLSGHSVCFGGVSVFSYWNSM